MDLLSVVYSVGLTLLGSVVIAYTTLWFQRRMQRKRIINSLCGEIVANLLAAQNNLKVLSGLEDHGRGEFTYFDIVPLHTFAYQTFQLSGEGLNLPDKVRMMLEETYDLISTHNRQVSLLAFEFPPRTGGMSKRLETIAQNLRSLQREMRIRSTESQ